MRARHSSNTLPLTPYPLPASARAYTLVELVVSLAVLSILLLAIGSSLTVALSATGNAATNAAAVQQSCDAADQIADDLNVAMNFTERTATAVTFTVPSRSGAATADTIRYAWAGTAGNPLTRQFNGGTVATLFAN